jgi:SSS family solute:Na+ symporter
MTVHLIPLLILVGYGLLTLVAANIVLRKKLGSDHFLVAGRSLPFTMVTGVILGDMVGGASTIGVCQRGFDLGIVSWLYSVALALAFFIFASTMAARYRKWKAVTIPEVMGRLFDKRTRVTTALVIAVTYFVIGITQIMAGAALLSPIFNVPTWAGALISALLFMVIMTSGGLKSIAVVNIIQVFFIFLGMLVAIFASLAMIGGNIQEGFSMLINNLPESYWKFNTRPFATVSGEMLGTILTFFAAQAAITGIFAARNHQTAVRATWVAGFMHLVIGLGFTILGMAAKIHFGDSVSGGLTAAPGMMLELHPIIAGIALCGLFSAIMSTGPLNFLAPVQIFMRDFYSEYINPLANDRKLLRLSRGVTIIVIMIGWILAVTFVEILHLTYWAFAFRAGIAVIILAVTYLGSRRISEAGAFWGLLAGAGIFVLWSILGTPFNIHEAIPSMLTCLLSAIVISKLKPRIKEIPILKE